MITFRNLTQGELNQIFQLNQEYGSEIQKLNFFRESKGFTNCQESEVLRFYKNLCEFTKNDNPKIDIIDVTSDHKKKLLEHSGYVPNLLNKMLVMIYNIYHNEEKRLQYVNETIDYHNKLVNMIIPPPFTLHLMGDINEDNNKEKIFKLCNDKSTLYIVFCEKKFFLDSNPLALLYPLEKQKNIWYTTTNTKTVATNNAQKIGFYENLLANKPYAALHQLYSFSIDNMMKGIQNFKAILKTFRGEEYLTNFNKSNSKDIITIETFLPKVQIVTIIQKDMSSD